MQQRVRRGPIPSLRCAFLLLLWAPAATLAQPSTVGGELQVNSETADDQIFPAAVVSAGGGFVVVWESYYQDGDDEGIFAQLFSAAGDPLGGEFLVNSHTPAAQRQPAIAAADNGDFVVVWESAGQDSSSSGVFGQRFDSTGATLGGEFQVNSFTVGGQGAPVVAMDGSGRFVVVWESDQQDGSFRGIFGQRYDSAGEPQGGEFQVNTHTAFGQGRPALAMDGSGGFVVVWESDQQDGSFKGIFAQRYDSAGVPQGDEFQVNSATVEDQASPAIAVTGTNTTFVVVWESYGYGVFGQLLDADGTPLGGEFQVNASTSGAKLYTYPAVAGGEAGDFVVVWSSSPDEMYPFVRDIFGRHFDSTATPLGGDFQINTTTAYDQSYPAASMSGGRLVVVWQSYQQDGSYNGVFGQRLSAALLDIDRNGSVEALTDGLLLLRHLFGFTGAALVGGALGDGCTRCDAAEIGAYIESILDLLDVDDNGSVGALSDALLILRHLLAFTDAALVDGAVAADCERCDAAAIAGFARALGAP